MALVLADRVKETTTTAGTGAVTLAGASAGFQTFLSTVGNGNTTYYVIAGQGTSEWEVGIGTYTSAGNTLSRDTVLSSSNSGSLVTFSSGTKDVWVDYAAGKAVTTDTLAYPPAIGSTTPAAGTFTTLTATGQASLGGAVGSEGLRVVTTASAINWVEASGTSTAFGTVSVSANGASSAVNLGLRSKGTGSIILGTNAGAQTQLVATHTASAVNYVQVTGGATGFATAISSQGSDSVIDLNLQAKSTGQVKAVNATNSIMSSVGLSGFGSFLAQSSTGSAYYFAYSGGSEVGRIAFSSSNAISFQTSTSANIQFAVAHTASAVNYLTATGGATGFGPVVSAQGSDTNISLVIQPKGTGALQAQQTDSTATGGNARGANAVDWQTSRGVAARVASGPYAVVSGGISNQTNGYGAVTSGGEGNISNGYDSFVGGGSTNTVTKDRSAIVGGFSNTAAGVNNFIGAGISNSGTSGSAVTTQSATMNGTTAVTLAASNASIKVGQWISGTSIASETYVAAVSGTSLTLSQAASGSSTSTLSFYTPHGVVVGGGNNQATGSYSFIGGGGDAGTAGNRNVASGDWSFVGGGIQNQATGLGSVIAGGGYVGAVLGNTASGTAAAVLGGISNNASALYATILGGRTHTGNGNYSTIVGAGWGSTRGLTGYTVFPASSAPVAGTAGTSQAAMLVLGTQTTTASATILTSDGSAATTTNQVILPNNAAYYFKGSVIANVTGAANGAAWRIEGAIMRGANAASTVLIGTPTVDRIGTTAGASAWVVTATADTTNGGLAITVTGAAATTIRWVAKLETTEVTF